MSTESDDIMITVSGDGISTLSLNRVGQLNALNGSLLFALRKQLEDLARDPGLRLLILKSELKKAFCSGVDVRFVQSLSDQDAAEFFADLAGVLETIASFPYPTLAIISGYAFGAGADLALACDLRISDEAAKFRFPGPQFGLILGTSRLIHEVGPPTARMLTLTGKTVDARTALQYGLVHHVANDDAECHEVVHRWATNVAQMPRHAVRVIRELTLPVGALDLATNAAHSVALARESVLDGAFSDRFERYLARNRK